MSVYEEVLKVSIPAWQYDEFRQVGTDYGSVEEIAEYDERMRRLGRNSAEEVRHILSAVEATPESVVLEVGIGTGEFAIMAAGQCAQVYAVDVSKPMLDYASEKALSRGVDNIRFVHAGFLTYEIPSASIDVVVSQLALHHLPDYWKAVALTRICDVLKPGGRLFLKDVVFTGDVRHHTDKFGAWISAIESSAGATIAQEVTGHIRDEYSTLDWVVEGLIKASGLTILSADYGDGFFGTYVCEKK